MVKISKYLEKSEDFFRKNTTVLLLLFIISLLILLYVKYHKYTVREGNATNDFVKSINRQKKNYIDILRSMFNK